jgi:gluconolactonase
MNIIIKTCLIAAIPLTGITLTAGSYAKVPLTMNSNDTTYNTEQLFDADTKPQLISKQFKFTEGPAADNDGNVFFTDQPNNSIWKYGIDGKLTLFTDQSGRSNGMYFDKKGHLLTCADEQNQIWSFDAHGKKSTVLLTDIAGHKFNGPNDLWVDGKGGIYFTDPYYQRDYWTRSKSELDGEKVYYLAKGKSQPVKVNDKLKKPNGIIGTADGKHLFVADIGGNKTYKFDILENGALTNQQLFTNMGSDGMTLDERGNVYLTGDKGVTIFNEKGEKIGLIAISQPWTGNICFGGKNRDMLFITASTSVYIFQMKVKGLNKNASKQQ